MDFQKLKKEFENIKITEKKIEEIKFALNDYYSILNGLNTEYFYLKNDANSNINDLKNTTKQIKKVKLDIKNISNKKVFKDNIKFSKELYKEAKKTKIDKNIEYAKKEVVEAKKLYVEFKKNIYAEGRGLIPQKINDIAIEIKNLSFKYSEDAPLALNDVSLQINKQEYVTIIGHNGSGKSTLSKILIGVLFSNNGRIDIFGNSFNKITLSKVRRFLGIVFQNPDNQFIGSTVEYDIAFGLENKGVDSKDMPDIIYNSAKKVRMENFLDKEPLNLSGGQKQRIAIASTLALDPEIIIFDEATSMLDPKGKREIKEIMLELKNKQKKTIISITHDMDEILNSDKVIVMDKGKIVKIGKPEVVVSDKEFLRKIQLDLPFIHLVKESLENNNIKVKKNIFNIDDLVDELCKK